MTESQSIATLIQAANVGQKAGAYSLQEASFIAEAARVLTEKLEAEAQAEAMAPKGKVKPQPQPAPETAPETTEVPVVDLNRQQRRAKK